MEILGIVYNTHMTGIDHATKRINNCRRVYYSYNNVGLCYPGLHTDAKKYLWTTICQPVLTYGAECVNLSKNVISQMESMQGTLVKNFLGIGKRSHHSQLLRALHIPSVEEVIKNNTLSLFHRIIKVQSPLRGIILTLMSKYITSGTLYDGSIVSRITKYGHSLVKTALLPPKSQPFDRSEVGVDGLVDSLQLLIYSDNYFKPWSAEHILTALLTRAF